MRNWSEETEGLVSIYREDKEGWDRAQAVLQSEVQSLGSQLRQLRGGV